MQSIAVDFMVLKDAIGSIQPDKQQQARLDEFTNRVGGGEFLRPTETMIVSDCKDGRCGNVGPLRPNAAGGSESLMVADDLTTKTFSRNGHTSTCEQYETLLNYLLANAYPIGGHTSDSARGLQSGCGANDLLPEIYGFIAHHGSTLRLIAHDLGIDVDGETHELITKNARERTSFSSGAELLRALKKYKNARTSLLSGAHREVVALINTREFTTLDRNAVRDEFGDNYQAFNADIWAFEKSAKVISTTSREQQQKFAAMVYYNLATAHVLAGPSLRVVVVK